MCGRFAFKAPPISTQEHFHLPESADLSSRYKIAPSHAIVVAKDFPQKSIIYIDIGIFFTNMGQCL